MHRPRPGRCGGPSHVADIVSLIRSGHLGRSDMSSGRPAWMRGHVRGFPGVLHWQTSGSLDGAACPQMMFPLYIDDIIVSGFCTTVSSFRLPLQFNFI